MCFCRTHGSTPARGFGGMPSPENVRILGALRLILVQSEGALVLDFPYSCFGNSIPPVGW